MLLRQESAQIGFAIPVIGVGGGVSITFGVERSTLVRWLSRGEAQAGEE